MSKWSTSLPSIVSYCNDVQLDVDPGFMQQQTGPTAATSISSSNKNLRSLSGSFSDLSMLIQSQPSYIDYNGYSTNYTKLHKPSTTIYETAVEHGATMQTEISSQEQFAPDDNLLQSLVAYADSFNYDSSDYLKIIQQSQAISIKPTPMNQSKIKPDFEVPTAVRRRRTQSSTAHLTSAIENDSITRHRSCEDLSVAGSVQTTIKSVTVVPQDEYMTRKRSITKFVPSESHPQFLFATKSDENMHPDDNNNDVDINNDIFEADIINDDVDIVDNEKCIDEGTTTMDGLKFDWEMSSDTINELNKPFVDSYPNYEATTNIADINLNYLKDLERCSSVAASMSFSNDLSAPIPPAPLIIRKKSKDFVLKQQVDIQLLRPPTPPPPAPIIIREVRHKRPMPHKPITIHQKLENSGQIHISKTPSPIVIRERPPLPPRTEYSSKPTVVYRRLPTPPPSPPTIIVERLRPKAPTIIKKPPPILVEKWLPYPPEQKPKIIYERASPLPIRNKRTMDDPPKKIIVEYDDLNVIVNKDVRQRREIKRVRPDQYMQQYGNSLCSNENVQRLLHDFTDTIHVNSEYPMTSEQTYYPRYSPTYHR